MTKNTYSFNELPKDVQDKLVREFREVNDDLDSCITDDDIKENISGNTGYRFYLNGSLHSFGNSRRCGKRK